ncbi:MBL fold metallo-hydrolase [Paracoccus spongiarum]|uniref:MBL fold metallo-hydrolase n=1 Tax=Paracoccus spongiarum TaxID=3064387 RepID=A0ABT9J7A8_9RHOB|nr:MBL fold metallo-hydrolase [Paracoccus sp. 2205BS29-5]MDP5305698.1 MBL fold metallo-hydrolase [Paracoccus sp. 2205BS29-5]
MPFRTAIAAICLACLALLPVRPAEAQQPRRMSHCIAIADAAPGIEYLHRAAWTDPVPGGELRLSYLGHSMVLIQTASGLSIVTDYNGNLGATGFRPDVVTMNRAHSSHWSTDVDGIAHVLRGWSEQQFGTPADHHLTLGEVLIRNVTTDIRGPGTVEEHGNSIFVFEAEGLCVAHLGHLHQEPNDRQYAALGRVDVLMVPVDGTYTMDLGTMMRVVGRLRSSLVIPVHWFSQDRLGAFLAGMSGQFLIRRAGGSELRVSADSLPRQPTVVVLDPAPLTE